MKTDRSRHVNLPDLDGIQYGFTQLGLYWKELEKDGFLVALLVNVLEVRAHPADGVVNSHQRRAGKLDRLFDV
jgi:hypothetical protein